LPKYTNFTWLGMDYYVVKNITTPGSTFLDWFQLLEGPMEWLDNLNGNDMRLDMWGMCFFVATATTVEPWRTPAINWGASQLRMLQVLAEGCE
jgi:hypothetical protein